LLTTAFNSTVLSMDFDTNVVKRRCCPAFYGFVPDGAERTAMFRYLLLFSLTNLILISTALALAFSINCSLVVVGSSAISYFSY